MAILSDVDIKERISKHQLIVNGDLSNVGPACYELSMGTVYYNLTENNKRFDVKDEGKVLIKPGHRVVLITKEEVNIPNELVAKVNSKGSLFSIGLSPVSTYADPGFSGSLGLVTQNFSDKYIEINVGEKIAKMDFSMLSGKCENIYKGQHGFSSGIWPIKTHLQKDYEEVKNNENVDSELDEAFKLLPKATAQVLIDLQDKQRKINFSILIFLVVNLLVVACVKSELWSIFTALSVNLISSAIVGTFMWNIKPKR